MSENLVAELERLGLLEKVQALVEQAREKESRARQQQIAEQEAFRLAELAYDAAFDAATAEVAAGAEVVSMSVVVTVRYGTGLRTARHPQIQKRGYRETVVPNEPDEGDALYEKVRGTPGYKQFAAELKKEAEARGKKFWNVRRTLRHGWAQAMARQYLGL